jgi:DNA-binding response OmpR family regulator
VKKILYIEDEEFLGRIVSESLVRQGYAVKWLHTGNGAVEQFRQQQPDICIIDIMLPVVDGYTIGKAVRAIDPGVPVIFLTARTTTDDVVKGFESGGTDYIRKPFSMEELLARIENQLRISGRGEEAAGSNGASQGEPAEMTLGCFSYRPSLAELRNGGEVMHLPNRENQVLEILTRNINGVTDRRHLLLTVWGDDSFFNSRTLDVYIRRLRSRFAPDPSLGIRTLKGKGYILVSSRDSAL